jgi:hypothetical protein
MRPICPLYHVNFSSLEYIIDCFGGLSLSPRMDGSDAAVMGSSHSGPLSPLWTMIRDSTEDVTPTFCK